MKYIDLGLPSGTLWVDVNEEGFYTFNEAVEKYGDSLPTFVQLTELYNLCKWEWVDDGYKVIGLNGNCIVLPADGYHNGDGNVRYVGSNGVYWSSTHYDSDHAWYLFFNSDFMDINNYKRCYGLSVRLVKTER